MHFYPGTAGPSPSCPRSRRLSSDWREPPPSEEFPFIQESEALEILFCRKGGLILEWAGHRRLSLSADQVLFLPVRTEAYRGQFASESFYGTLVRMEAKAAWSALRAMHSDLGESISRAWNDPCMLKAALWSEALFSALDYMQPWDISEITMSSRRWRFCSCSMHSERGWPYLRSVITIHIVRLKPYARFRNTWWGTWMSD